jgi:hypothetical protein
MTRFRDTHPLVQLVAGLLLVEAAMLAVVFLILFSELVSGNFQSIYAEIFLLLLAAGSTAWVITFTRQMIARRRWARSAAFFWQLLQAAVGAGALAEEGGNFLFGLFLVGISVVVLVLLFNKKVVQETNEVEQS